jgi:hypothetical protein
LTPGSFALLIRKNKIPHTTSLSFPFSNQASTSGDAKSSKEKPADAAENGGDSGAAAETKAAEGGDSNGQALGMADVNAILTTKPKKEKKRLSIVGIDPAAVGVAVAAGKRKSSDKGGGRGGADEGKEIEDELAAVVARMDDAAVSHADGSTNPVSSYSKPRAKQSAKQQQQQHGSEGSPPKRQLSLNVNVDADDEHHTREKVHEHSRSKDQSPRGARPGGAFFDSRNASKDSSRTSSITSINKSIKSSPALPSKDVEEPLNMTTLLQSVYVDAESLLFISSLPPCPQMMPLIPMLPPINTKLSNGKHATHTLVLDLDETLVHSSLEPMVGANLVVDLVVGADRYVVNVFVRPFVKEFLEEIAKHFEVVVFTGE